MEKKIIEVNGIKMEMDMRTASVQSIDTFKVGDAVMVLIKEDSKTQALPAVITAFANFKEKPTIVVHYLRESWSSVELKVAYINSDTTDTQIVLVEDGVKSFESSRIKEKFEKEVRNAEDELLKKQRQLDNFNRTFGMLCSEIIERPIF